MQSDIAVFKSLMFRSETICVANKRVTIQKFKVGIEIELLYPRQIWI